MENKHTVIIPLFDIIERDENNILKIVKSETGEIFTRGCSFYSKKYGKLYENMYFDDTLTGTYFGKEYYRNYVRCSQGLFHLDEIELYTAHKNIIKDLQKGDKIYYVRFSYTEKDSLHKLNIVIENYSTVRGIVTMDNSDIRINISSLENMKITTLKQNEYEDHCFLRLNSDLGYDEFFTLKPENIQEDVIRKFYDEITKRLNRFNEEKSLLDKKIQLITDNL